MQFPLCRSRFITAIILVATAWVTPVHSATMLPPCPDTPNCVSSLAVKPSQKVAPFTFDGPAGAAQSKLMQVIEHDRNATVIDARQGWIAVEFRSRFMGFVDDVRFELDDSGRLFHVQSSSRSGYWDFGVNRRRLEALRLRFDASR